MSGNSEQVTATERVQLVVFSLAAGDFAVEIGVVREIVQLTQITPIPRSPDYVAGVCNLRGNIVPVIDGRKRLSLKGRDTDPHKKRLLVIDREDGSFALIVDQLKGMVQVERERLELPPQICYGVKGDFFHSVVKQEEQEAGEEEAHHSDENMIMVLDEWKIVEISQVESKGEQWSGGVPEATQQMDEPVEEQQILTFTVGGKEYGLNIRKVREIIKVSSITPVPNVPETVRGLMTQRNQLLPILDTRTIFSAPPMEGDDDDRNVVIVIDAGELRLGLLIDQVNDVIRVPLSQIEETQWLTVSKSRQLQGVAKLDGGKRLIMMIDEDTVVSANDLSLINQLDSTAQQKRSINKRKITMDELQLVTFFVDQQEYALKIKEIREINRISDVTKVPGSPPFVDGVTNLRGEVTPLINVRKLFGLEQIELDNKTRVIIVSLDGNNYGLRVDQVNNVLHVPLKLIENTPSMVLSEGKNRFMDGICKLDGGKRVVVIINLQTILQENELKQLQQVNAISTETASAADTESAPSAKPQTDVEPTVDDLQEKQKEGGSRKMEIAR